MVKVGGKAFFTYEKFPTGYRGERPPSTYEGGERFFDLWSGGSTLPFRDQNNPNTGLDAR